MGVVVKTISAMLPLYCIFYVLGILTNFGVLFFDVSFRAGFLGIVLVLVFLLYPVTKKGPRNRLPWYDLLLILLALTTTAYQFIMYPQTAYTVRVSGIADEVMFFILLLVLFEAIRRTIGPAVLAVIVLFFLYAKFCYLLPGLWGAPTFDLRRLTEYMYQYDTGIFGFILGIPATLIILFITFGAFLMNSGAGTSMSDVAISLGGRYRGGPAKVSILNSTLVGIVSGSASATAAASGSITIPLMKKYGYRDYFAGAVEAVSAVGGVVSPPIMGSIAFLIAEITGLGYAAVCAAAILPTVLYYVCIYFQVDFEAAKLKLVGMPREQLPSLKKAMRSGWYLLLPIAILIALMAMDFDVKQAVLLSTLAAIAVSWFRKETRMGFGKVVGSLADGAQGVLIIGPVMAAAGLIMGAISLSGLVVNLSTLIRELAGGNIWLLAILVWAAIYISGMGIGEVVVYIVMSIVVLPAFFDLGVAPLAAHLFLFYICCSMFITPPNCPAVFVVCSIAGSNMWRTAFQAMKLGIVTFLVPFLILLDPAFILMGSPVHIVVAMVTAIVGALFLAAGIEGYLLAKANWWQRIFLVVGGLGLFIPGTTIHIVALVLLVPLLAQVKTWRATKLRLAIADPSDANHK